MTFVNYVISLIIRSVRVKERNKRPKIKIVISQSVETLRVTRDRDLTRRKKFVFLSITKYEIKFKMKKVLYRLEVG